MSPRTAHAIAAAHPHVPRIVYSMQEVAAALGIDYHRALIMRKEGVFPSFKVGRKWRVRPADLDAAVQALRDQAAGTPSC